MSTDNEEIVTDDEITQETEEETTDSAAETSESDEQSSENEQIAEETEPSDEQIKAYLEKNGLKTAPAVEESAKEEPKSNLTAYQQAKKEAEALEFEYIADKEDWVANRQSEILEERQAEAVFEIQAPMLESNQVNSLISMGVSDADAKHVGKDFMQALRAVGAKEAKSKVAQDTCLLVALGMQKFREIQAEKAKPKDEESKDAAKTPDPIAGGGSKTDLRTLTLNSGDKYEKDFIREFEESRGRKVTSDEIKEWQKQGVLSKTK